MHTLPSLLITALLAAPLAGAAQDPAARPLRPLDRCLDPDRARSFVMLDSDELLVDAGRRRYHLQLTFGCPELTHNHALVFRPGTAVGRICGNPGDALLLGRPGPQRLPCGIATVTPVEKGEWDALLARGRSATGSVSVREDPPR